MSYVVEKYRHIKNKVYGPYLHEVRSVREGETVRQIHIAYLGKGQGAVVASLSTKSSSISHILVLDKPLSKKEEDVLKDITLWTSGSFKVVREPEKFETVRAPVRGVQVSAKGDQRHLEFVPVKSDYVRANKTMQNLAEAKSSYKGGLYRGLALSKDAVNSMKPGTTHDIGKLSSFTTDGKVATGFAISGAKFAPSGKVPVKITITKAIRGTDISKLSRFGEEKEFISSGKFKVTNVARFQQLTVIDGIQI